MIEPSALPNDSTAESGGTIVLSAKRGGPYDPKLVCGCLLNTVLSCEPPNALPNGVRSGSGNHPDPLVLPNDDKADANDCVPCLVAIPPPCDVTSSSSSSVSATALTSSRDIERAKAEERLLGPAIGCWAPSGDEGLGDLAGDFCVGGGADSDR